MTTDTAEARRAQLERDGYVVLPNLFTPAEVSKFRRVVGGFLDQGGTVYNLGKTQPNAAIECPDLADLFGDDRVVTAFRELVGDRGVMFTGHCDIHKDMFSNWHKDTGGPDHGYFAEDCFVPGVQVYKMALYLQDHTDGEGLTVRPGSHRDPKIAPGAEVSIPSRAGDAVVFDVRISHRGRLPDAVDRTLYLGSQAVTRTLDKLAPSKVRRENVKAAYWLKSTYERAIGRPSRMSIFFTYGAVNRFTLQFAEANMSRQLEQYAAGDTATYPPRLAARLREAEVELYDPLAPKPLAHAA